MHRTRDTVLLSGWLFADLMLGLAVLFLVANSAGITLKPPAPPTLIVTPPVLDANANPSKCTGGLLAPQCTVTVQESQGSEGAITWNVKSDINDNIIKYSVPSDDFSLSPGKSVQLTISAIPCQNGSFTFNATRTSDKTPVSPVIVSWHCVPVAVKPERLDFNYQRFSLSISDVNAFVNGNSLDDNVRQQVKDTQILQGKNVGLAIVYGGTPDTVYISQAQAVATKVYSILGSLTQYNFSAFARSSYYVPLYTLGPPQSRVDVDVYFLIR